MKSFLVALTVFVSLNAFAGPEDHIANQTCYALAEAQLKTAPLEVPRQVCLESLTVDTANQKISAYSYFQQDLYRNLKLESTVRKNEDWVHFSASSVFIDVWDSGCGYGDVFQLKINGLVNYNDQVSLSQLEVSVHVTSTNDTCHSVPRTTVYNYILQ